MKMFRGIALLTLLISLSIAAHAQCWAPQASTYNNILVQDCPGSGTVAVANTGGYIVNVEFYVYYIGGGQPGHWIVTIAPGTYVVRPAAGPVSNIAVARVF
jgi:hypothetical protein